MTAFGRDLEAGVMMGGREAVLVFWCDGIGDVLGLC